MGAPVLEAFRTSLTASAPSPALPPPLAALWWAGKDDWHRAHAIVQEAEGSDAAWVHAYLHRVEGDPGNAAYWYRRAGRPVATDGLAHEWEAIAATLLGARAPDT